MSLFFFAKVLKFIAMNSDFVLLFILSSSNYFKNTDSNNMICIHDEKIKKCISGYCFIFILYINRGYINLFTNSTNKKVNF